VKFHKVFGGRFLISFDSKVTGTGLHYKKIYSTSSFPFQITRQLLSIFYGEFGILGIKYFLKICLGMMA